MAILPSQDTPPTTAKKSVDSHGHQGENRHVDALRTSHTPSPRAATGGTGQRHDHPQFLWTVILSMILSLALVGLPVVAASEDTGDPSVCPLWPSLRSTPGDNNAPCYCQCAADGPTVPGTAITSVTGPPLCLCSCVTPVEETSIVWDLFVNFMKWDACPDLWCYLWAIA